MKKAHRGVQCKYPDAHVPIIRIVKLLLESNRIIPSAATSIESALQQQLNTTPNIVKVFLLATRAHRPYNFLFSVFPRGSAKSPRATRAIVATLAPSASHRQRHVYLGIHRRTARWCVHASTSNPEISGTCTKTLGKLMSLFTDGPTAFSGGCLFLLRLCPQFVWLVVSRRNDR